MTRGRLIKGTSPRANRKRGAALLEFAVILPVLL